MPISTSVDMLIPILLERAASQLSIGISATFFIADTDTADTKKKKCGYASISDTNNGIGPSLQSMSAECSTMKLHLRTFKFRWHRTGLISLTFFASTDCHTK